MTYICSKCGSDHVRVNPARPSIDERYALGYCLAERKGEDDPPERTLVVRDVRTLRSMEERDERKRQKRLVGMVRRGTLRTTDPVKREAQIAEAEALMREKGW